MPRETDHQQIGTTMRNAISTICRQPQGLLSCDSRICETDGCFSLLLTNILLHPRAPQLQAHIVSACSSRVTLPFPIPDYTTLLVAPLHTDSVLLDSSMDS